MDTLWNCTYGMDIDVQNNPQNEYFHAAEKVFIEAHQFKVFKFLSGFLLFLEFLIKKNKF